MRVRCLGVGTFVAVVKVYRRFRGSYCLYHKSDEEDSKSLWSLYHSYVYVVTRSSRVVRFSASLCR